MFVLNKDRVVAWPVTVRVPVDGGKFEEQVFTARFKLLSQAQIDELTGRDAGDVGLLRAALVGWDGIMRENGGAIPFDEKVRDEMLGVPYVRLAILAAFMEATVGAKRKN